MPTRRRSVYLNLYVVLDLYSHFIVAWMVSDKENAALAQQLFQEAVDRNGIPHGALTLHQDRGSPMITRSYLDLMCELGVTCSHSRRESATRTPSAKASSRPASTSRTTRGASRASRTPGSGKAARQAGYPNIGYVVETRRL